MRSRLPLVLLLSGCSQILGIGDLSGPDDAGTKDGAGRDVPGPAVDCKAQRVVHLIAGNGGFSWFSLVWPAPFVITNFQPMFAYDEPANAKDVTTDPTHPLFARRIGVGAVWEGHGQAPQPSVFIAGTNETHTSSPQSIVRGGANNGAELVAAGAALQTSLAPPLPVLAFGNAQPYGPAPGAPSSVLVNDVEGAISVLRGTGAVTPEMEQLLRPSAAQLASYVAPGAPQVSVTLATQLAFTANAFHFGLIGSVIMPAFNDDPHGAFSGGIALPAQRANDLATTLDAFYRDLDTGSEPLCGRGGNFLSVADNTVLIVTGDTPKNSFDNAGWADGTPGGANWMYLRSNGFTKPGWFGQILPGTRTNFDPTTGKLDPMIATSSSTAGTFAGALYAIARGDRAAVQAVTPAPFDGVILQ